MEVCENWIHKLEGGRAECRAQSGLDYHNSPLMAEIATGEYVHRSIDQLRSMNERGTLGAVIHDYKQFTDLRNNIVTDYTIKNNLNNNNNLIDNRNISANNINNQSPALDQKHQQHYSSSSTPPTPLSITDAQMNDAKVRTTDKWPHPGENFDMLKCGIFSKKIMRKWNQLFSCYVDLIAFQPAENLKERRGDESKMIEEKYFRKIKYLIFTLPFVLCCPSKRKLFWGNAKRCSIAFWRVSVMEHSRCGNFYSSPRPMLIYFYYCF